VVNADEANILGKSINTIKKNSVRKQMQRNLSVGSCRITRMQDEIILRWLVHSSLKNAAKLNIKE
jgi:hypothetical protein